MHWFNRAERETMLWSRKRKEMRNRLTATEYRCKGNVCSTDCRLKDYQSPNERLALTVGEQSPLRVRLYGRPAHSQDEMAPYSRRAGLIRDFRYVCNVGRFDADFLKKRRSAREPSAERFDEAIITFCAFGAGCRARLLCECRR